MLQNIIFDLGGVIYDIDHNLSKKAFLNLGVSNFDKLYGHHVQTALFEKMERGEIDEQEFQNTLRQYLPKNITDEQITNAWCALLVGFEKKKIDLLHSLREKYRLFILSNSNIIHIATHGFFYPDPKEVTAETEESQTIESTEITFRGGSRGFGK